MIKGGKTMKRKSKKVLCIALVLILIGSIGAAILQTNFNKVRVKDLYILTEEQ